MRPREGAGAGGRALRHRGGGARRGPSRLIAGVDEVGRGCLAGPVYAGAVVFDRRVTLPGLDDSKALLPGGPRRPRVPDPRAARRRAAVGAATAAEIDAIGIVAATLLAMRRALELLRGAGLRPVARPRRRGAACRASTSPQQAFIRGDARVAAIAAASIVAKVERDARMDELGTALSVLRFRITPGIRDARAHLRAPPSRSLAGAPVDVRPRSRPPRRVESGVTAIMASKRDALVASAEKSLAEGEGRLRAEGLPEGPRGDSRRHQHPEQGRRPPHAPEPERGVDPVLHEDRRALRRATASSCAASRSTRRSTSSIRPASTSTSGSPSSTRSRASRRRRRASTRSSRTTTRRTTTPSAAIGIYQKMVADGPAEHPAARQAGRPLLAGAPQGRRPQGVRGRRGPPARARRPRRVDPGLREGAADGAGQRRDPARVRPDSPGVGPRARRRAPPCAGRWRRRRGPSRSSSSRPRPRSPRTTCADAQEWLSKAQSIESSSAEVLALALKVQQAGGTTTLSFEAAAVLADQAMRRGEAKKALSILAPLAEANPGREDVLLRVIQVAEAAGDTQTVIRWRSALVDAHKSMGRIGDAATGLRALLQLVPDSAEYRTRLAAARASGGAPRRGPGRPARSADDPGRAAARDEREAARAPPCETSAQRRIPVEPAAPIPPPPSFAPAPPVAGAAEGEFILEFEDEQLVHEPGSTGPIPNAVRRLSQPVMASFAPPAAAPAPVVPPRAPLPPLELSNPRWKRRRRLLRRRSKTSASAGPRRRVRRHARRISRSRPRCPPMSSRFRSSPRPCPRRPSRSRLRAWRPSRSRSLRRPSRGRGPSEAESIEPSGEALPAVEQPAPVPEPEAPAEVSLAPDAIESALGEADVFRKYGLYDKAVDHLRGILKRAPDTLPLREKLFELALEGGRKNVAHRRGRAAQEPLPERRPRRSRLGARRAARRAHERRDGGGERVPPGPPARLLQGTPPRARPAAPRGARRRSSGPGGAGRAGRRRTEPPADELLEIDFCLEQGMVVDASERLQALERLFPGHPQLARRRLRLEGGAAEDARPALRDILSEDFESVLDAELGRALTDEMASGAESAPPATPVQRAAGAASGRVVALLRRAGVLQFRGRASDGDEAGGRRGRPSPR